MYSRLSCSPSKRASDKLTPGLHCRRCCRAVRAWEGDKAFLRCPKSIEERALSLTGKQLVIPLHVEQHRDRDTWGIPGKTWRHTGGGWAGRRLEHPVLAEDRTAETVASGRHHWHCIILGRVRKEGDVGARETASAPAR